MAGSTPSEIFNHILEGAKVIQVEPASCIPFIEVRKLVPSGIQRMKHSFESKNEHNVVSGAVAGGVLPTVVKLRGALGKHVAEYFQEGCGMEEGEAEERARSRRDWYGVIDGSHRLHAILELQKEYPQRWGRFRWCVMLLESKSTISVLRAFARTQNMKQCDNSYVETTQYDLLHGLQSEIPHLSVQLGGRRPNVKELAEGYSGCKGKTTSSMRYLASLALRISPEVVAVIGEITNFECPKLACTYYSSQGFVGLTQENVSSLVDCRVFRKFITTSSLRMASAFMNSTEADADFTRINTLHRLRWVCRLNGFRAVSYNVVNEQFSKAKSAMKEADKFERLLRSNVWPRGMEQIQENLLRNTVMDTEVEQNDGNESTILPSLIHSLRRICPDQAPLWEARFQASFDKSKNVVEMEEVTTCMRRTGDTEVRPVSVNPPMPRQANEMEDGCPPSMLHACSDGDREKKRNEKSDSILQRQIDKLRELGITPFRMEWQAYNRIFEATSDMLFDLMLTEPPHGSSVSRRSSRRDGDEVIGLEYMEDFISFTRRVLLPGGYVILFAPSRLLRDWVKAFRSNDFACMDYPLVIASKSEGQQRTNQQLFPQSTCEFAIMAVAPGRNPKGFKANFEEPYSLVDCEYKRKFALITGVEVVRRKLKFPKSKSLVRPEEKNPDMLAEVIVTFSPEGGRVLDPFAGTMSTGIACMETGRDGVVIEKDSQCYDLAFGRLLTLGRLYENEKQARIGLRRRITNEIPERQPDTSSYENSVLDLLKSDSEGTETVSPPRGSNGENERITPGSSVSLLIDGEVVGTAEVQEDPQSSERGYRTILHGQDLSKFAEEGADLVVVWRVEIDKAWEGFKYPYNYGGVEGPVRTLGEMHTGFHAWDLNEMLRAS